MKTTELQAIVDAAFEERANIDAKTKGKVRRSVDSALDLLDQGTLRVAEKTGGAWQVNQWLKKAVLLSFRLNDMALIGNGPGNG
jgi:2,3,4,5-tetrahydropyridine-2-carboxylate N-succinyltransferase